MTTIRGPSSGSRVESLIRLRGHAPRILLCVVSRASPMPPWVMWKALSIGSCPRTSWKRSASTVPCSEPRRFPGATSTAISSITSSSARYVLQRVNDRVFSDVDTLLSNVERVTAHMRCTAGRDRSSSPPTTGPFRFRRPMHRAGAPFIYLEATVGRRAPTGPVDAFEAARAFADYLMVMEDLPGPPLPATIERFHDLRRRTDALEAVVAADPVGRRSGSPASSTGSGASPGQVADAARAPTPPPPCASSTTTPNCRTCDSTPRRAGRPA